MARPTLAAAAAALALVVACVGAASAPPMAGAQPPHAHVTAKKPQVHRAQTKRPVHRHVAKAKPRRPTLGARAVQIANHLTWTPYVWGGESPAAGFDCSGLVRYVYGRLGIELPHHAASQYALGRSVPPSRLRAGDLVFFSGLGHVGIYAGHGKFIHAPRSGQSVRWQRLSSRMSGYVGARRIVST
jgi:cell wall-associated NlpC family hydrolase